VLVTAARIKDGDGWVREWTATADAVESAGGDAAAAGRRASARAYQRRAATYLATALDQIDGSHQHQAKVALWPRQRACWERIVDLSGGERVAIPYDGPDMPAFFFRAPDAAPGSRARWWSSTTAATAPRRRCGCTAVRLRPSAATTG
jgi:hypothetical protein